MKTTREHLINGVMVFAIANLIGMSFATAQDAAEPLPSWNDGSATTSIVEFVAKTARAGSPDFVAPADRIATFDQDGTLWVEHPMYAQMMYCLERVPIVLWKNSPSQN